MAGENLSRNTQLFVSTIKDDVGTAGTHVPGNTFEVRVLDGYSFDQTTETSEITLSEAGCTPTRGQKIYNTALNPVEFSFETYIRPYEYTNVTDFHACVEHILWNALISDTAHTQAAAETTGLAMDSSDGQKLVIDFTESDKNELLDLYLFFHLENATYRVNEAKVTSAEIDFSIDSIAKITWTGSGLTVSGETSTDAITHANVAAWVAGTDYTAVPAAASFIKNKLSSMTIDTYNIPLTGGSLTIENNVEFLTPEELAVVNQPIGSFTGTRSISGSVTAYLRTSAATDETGDLYQALINDTASVTNSKNVTITIGSCAATSVGPFVELKLPTAHLVIPTINVEDVISTEIAFTGIGTGLDQADELSIWYVNSGDGVV